jgi:16S rRNA (guanine527-N7)-methyltransferase
MVGAPPNLPAHVSRETMQRLETIVEQVRRWQERINLVAPSTVDRLWERHVEDSLQLHPLAPDARRWLDLGSGGGFPGLVIAACAADTPGFTMTLVESNGKKCAFLRETARIATLPVTVHQTRIEDFARKDQAAFDVVSARAIAPLPLLLDLAAPFLAAGAIGLFPKGEDVEDEIAAASGAWQVEFDLIQSQTEPGARILRIRSAIRRTAGGPGKGPTP